MNSLFDSAGLAIVAYAEVAADGTSVVNTTHTAAMNSGVTTTKTATGTYQVILPADKTQEQSRDLIFVQPNGTTPMFASVDETDPPAPALPGSVKTVYLSSLATIADGAFTILILRTIIPPPAGAPA
jgi:hypothetical protein